MPGSSPEHFDVLVIGAGLSGIGAAYHLQTRCPTRTYAILEGRDAIGGTWDLFRYPGVRSDSDMFTLGYRFRPWRESKAIADGASINAYIENTASEYGIDKNIRFRHRVTRAEWSSSSARWSLMVEVGPERTPVLYTCNFLCACTGYYEYESGYAPTFPGRDHFRGRVVHPQCWPDDLDYTGKRVVVIGSGATAITLVPSMADKAAHVTMLQRSPTYVVTLPVRDALAVALRRVLPKGATYAALRWKNVLLGMFLYQLARRFPALVKRMLRQQALRALGPNFDVDTHFKPRYEPWDERVCDVPNIALAVGYTNASWTLKCELIAEHVCRILNHMREHNYARVTPRLGVASMESQPILDIKSGYVQRALASLPRQGTRAPWRLNQNYVKDLFLLRYGRVTEDELEFACAPQQGASPAAIHESASPQPLTLSVENGR